MQSQTDAWADADRGVDRGAGRGFATRRDANASRLGKRLHAIGTERRS